MTVTLALAALAGVGGAAVTIAFHAGIHAAQLVFAEHPGPITQVMRDLSWPLRLLVPAAGGLLAGLLLAAANRASRDPHADYMEAVAIGDGRMPVRQGLLRSLSSLSTVASGGSIGREGAMVHLAALSASVLGRVLRFPTGRLRLLTACGAAAGVSAAYGAPLAGAVFVGEIILGSMSFQSYGPLLVAAASSSLMMHATGAYAPRYPLPDLASAPVTLLLPCLALAVIAGIGAPQFLRSLKSAKALFGGTGLELPLRLALGGLALGGLLTQLPQLAGNGNSVVGSFLQGEWAWRTVLVLLACKLLATALTVGSGAIGGVFTPTLFVGTALGVLFGQALSVAWPGLGGYTTVFALVGMGAFLAAATTAPLMAILMVFEMTLDAQILLPLALPCVVACFVSRAFASFSMYEVTQRRENEEALRSELRHAPLATFIRPPETVVSLDAPLSEAQEIFLTTPVRYLYVTDAHGTWQGAIAQQDLARMLLGGAEIGSMRCAAAVRTDLVTPLNPGMSLDEAEKQFGAHRGERLPVVSPGPEAQLVGVVYKSDLLEHYAKLHHATDRAADLTVPPRRNRG